MIGKKIKVLLLLFCVQIFSASGQIPAPFKSSPLKEKGALDLLMLEGIDRFLTGETERFKKARPGHWQRDFSSAPTFNQSIQPQREILKGILGIVDEPASPHMVVMNDSLLKPFSMELEDCYIQAVIWDVLKGKYHGMAAEGLYLKPKGE